MIVSMTRSNDKGKSVSCRKDDGFTSPKRVQKWDACWWGTASPWATTHTWHGWLSSPRRRNATTARGLGWFEALSLTAQLASTRSSLGRS